MSAATGGSDPAQGQRFGDYVLVRLLGEGAMGRVWLARETHPPRDVAVKMLHGPYVRADFQQRFRREIRLLGALEHPDIARLYSAGEVASAAGPVPYLAMEHVRGVGLLEHAEAHRLDLRARLALIARIARAVHYAHTRGVVHRDLKPANILVDERGEPKVLDFGVAHMASDEATQVTVTGQILGTLAYMAPEQLVAGAAHVDPRSDVYALGAIAYELLAGELPHEGLARMSAAAAIDAVVRGQPRRLGRLVPAVRGDVDTIVMKAIAADPRQRYASAAELAADIERWLASEPIAARPPTAAYLAALFVRRHRVLSAASVVVVLALVAATAVSLRFASAEARARTIAETRLAESEAVSGFLQTMLTSADPERTLGRQLTVREIADAARASLAADRELPPATAARLMNALGVTYDSLGESETAVALLERACALSTEANGEHAAATLRIGVALAFAHLVKGENAAAESLLRELQSGPAAAGSADPELALRIRHGLGWAAVDDRRVSEGLELLALAHADAHAQLGGDDPLTLTIAHDYAEALSQAGRHGEALGLQESVIEARSRLLGPSHPQTLYSRNAIAGPLFYLGEVERAESVIRDVLAERSRVLGERHISTLTTRQNLAATLIQRGKAAEGVEIADGILQDVRDHFGQQHWRTLRLLNIVAYGREELGRIAEAETAYREILAIAAAQDRSGDPEYLGIRNNLAMLLMNDGRSGPALAEFEVLGEQAQARLGAEHPYTAIFAGNHGECLMKLNRHREALPLLERSHAGLLAAFGTGHERVLKAVDRLNVAYAALGMAAGAP